MKIAHKDIIIRITATLLLVTLAGCMELPRDNPGDRDGDSYNTANAAKSFMSFTFTAAANSLSLSTDVSGVIEGRNVYVNVPYGTSVKSLIASFSVNGKAVDINGIEQLSGLSSNNFTNPVTYTVTAPDGTQQDITVIVSETIITSFELADPAVTGVINQANRTISVDVPYGTDVTALVAVFDAGASVTMEGIPQTSGVTPVDFTAGTHIYTVAGANGVTRDYTVTVTVNELRVSHLAGTLGGPGAVDGSWTDARFFNPGGITSDGTNLYIADTHNHVIRKMSLNTGEVTTIAGKAGVSGLVDGIGSNARFKEPGGITIAGSYLYVSDKLNHKIRRILIASGEVTTYSTANIAYPMGITTNGTNLYIVSWWDGSVNKLVISDGTTTQISTGLGPAFGITIDPDFSYLYVASTDGKIYWVNTASGSVTDSFTPGPRPIGISTDGTYLYFAGDDHTIRRVLKDKSGHTTIAGYAGQSGSTDGQGTIARFNFWLYDMNANGIHIGMTCDGPNLYLTDTFNNNIRKVAIGTRLASTIAGNAAENAFINSTGTAARFDRPCGVLPLGDYLYVTDYNNHAIRKITKTTGAVTTFTTGFVAPAGITWDGNNFYVSDGNGIKTVDPDGNVSQLSTSYPLYNTQGISNDGTHLYVVELCNACGGGPGFLFDVKKVSISDGTTTTLLNNTTLTGWVWDVTVNGQYVYLACDKGVVRVNKDSSDPVLLYSNTSNPELYYPMGIATDGSNLYIANSMTNDWDGSYNTIIGINLASGTGKILAGKTLVAGSEDGYGSFARFNFPRSIAVDSTNIYVSDWGNNSVRVLQP